MVEQPMPTRKTSILCLCYIDCTFLYHIFSEGVTVANKWNLKFWNGMRNRSRKEQVDEREDTSEA